MHLLGIDIDTLNRSELLARCERWLSSEEKGFHRIATVNPEFLLLARQDASFRQTLEAADLRIADGFGIVLAAALQGASIERFPGADLMGALLEMADKKKVSIYLVVRKDGLSSYAEVRAVIQKQYPDMEVEGADFESREMLDSKIQNLKSEIVFCNFGAPEQELFLESLRNTSNDIRIAMGVGGALDYLTGRIARAPRLWRRLGLEWLWRLIHQPSRLGRIWNATAVFLWCIVREKYFCK